MSTNTNIINNNVFINSGDSQTNDGKKSLSKADVRVRSTVKHCLRSLPLRSLPGHYDVQDAVSPVPTPRVVTITMPSSDEKENDIPTFNLLFSLDHLSESETETESGSPETQNKNKKNTSILNRSQLTSGYDTIGTDHRENDDVNNETADNPLSSPRPPPPSDPCYSPPDVSPRPKSIDLDEVVELLGNYKEVFTAHIKKLQEKPLNENEMRLIEKEKERMFKGFEQSEIQYAHISKETSAIELPDGTKLGYIVSSDGKVFINIREEFRKGGFKTITKSILFDDKNHIETIVRKKLHSSKLWDDAVFQEFIREYALQKQFDHPNITKNIAYVNHDGKLGPNPYIFSQISNMGTLEDIIFETPMNFNDRIKIAINIASGLGYMHEKGYVHNDLKPDNILLFRIEDDMIAKIDDFGRTAEIEDENSQVQFHRILPPESNGYPIKGTVPTDVYQYGLVLWHLFHPSPVGYQFAGNYSYPGAEDRFDHWPSDENTVAVKNIIEKCLSEKPENRPSMVEVHGLLQKIKPHV